MSFHWGDGPSQINQVVTVEGPGSATTTTPLTAAAKVEKKAPKAPIKTKAAAGARRVVAFELVFTSRVTRQQLTMRVPAVGAFHDRDRQTTLRDVKELGREIAVALNKAFHDVDKSPRR